MNATATIPSRREQRRCLRVRHNAAARVAVGPGRVAAVRCIEAGRGGLRLVLGHALEAGQRLVVRIGSHELLGRVAWTRTMRGGYVAGIQVFRDEPAAEKALSEVIYDALNATGATDSLRDDRRPLPAWTATTAPAPASTDLAGLFLTRLSVGAAAGTTLGLVLVFLTLGICAGSAL